MSGFSAKLLYAKATRKAKLLGSANWVRSNPLLGELVTFYRPAKGRKHLTTKKTTAKSKQSRQQAKREKEPYCDDFGCPLRVDNSQSSCPKPIAYVKKY